MGNNNNSSNSRFLEVQGAPSYSPLGAIPIDQFESVDPDNLEAAQELIEAYGADDPTEDLAAQLMQPQQQSSEFRYTDNGGEARIEDYFSTDDNEKNTLKTPKPPQNSNASTTIQYAFVQAPDAVQNFFKLRGSEWPNWFPGLFTAFPDEDDLRKQTSVPKTVGDAYWKLEPRIV